MVETVLVYAGIPLLVLLGVAVLTLVPGKKAPKYKPGKPWEYEPVWFEPHPEEGAHGGGSAGAQITGHGGATHDGFPRGPRELGAGHGGGTTSGTGGLPPGKLAAALAIGETPHGAGSMQPQVAGPAGGSTAHGSGHDDHSTGGPSTGGATAYGSAGADGLPQRTAAGGARGTW